MGDKGSENASNPPDPATYSQPQPNQGYPPGYGQPHPNQGYPPGYAQPGQPYYGAYPNQPGYHGQSTVVVGQQPVANVVVTSRPQDYLGFAIFTCLCCFWPTGIAAIVFACQSQSSSDRMDYAKAREEGNLAKIFSIVSLVIGLIWIIAVIIYVVVIFVVLADAISSISS